MRARAPIALVCAVVVGAGCADDAPPPAAPAATPVASAPASTPAPAPARARELPVPRGRALRFAATDGKPLQGTLYPARRAGAPAVVLVHEYRGGPGQWDPLLGALHRAGFASLTYESRDASELDETVLARDVAGAVAALRERPEVDPDRITLAGASIGATTVAYALGAGKVPDVRGGVGLSPVESPEIIGLGLDHRFRPHDLLLIADARELVDVRSIRMDAYGKGVTAFEASVSGHGVALLPDARTQAKLIGWLRDLA